MRLRSGRNTGSTLSKSPSISNREAPELNPRVHNNSQRGCSRHARRRRPLFYKLYNLCRLYLNGQTSKRPRSSLSDLPSPRFIPRIAESIKLVLEDLSLPFFDPFSSDDAAELDTEVSISLLSTRLGWSISSTDQIPIPAVLKDHSGCLASPLPVLLPLQAYARENGPSMNMLPTKYPEMRIYGHISHETQRFDWASLIFSREWEPFQSKPSFDTFGVSTDSSGITVEKLMVLKGMELPLRNSPSPIQPHSIAVRSNALVHPRARSQWETIRSFQMDHMDQPGWRVDASSNILERDERRRAGNIDYNQTSNDKDSWPQSSIPKLSTYDIPLFYAYLDGSDLSGGDSDDSLEFVDSRSSAESERRETLAIPMELAARHQLGDIIANIMTCDQLPVLRDVFMEPSWAMRCSNQNVTLNLASRVPPQRLPWENVELPILFAAQHCVKGNEDTSAAQMAHALHQTLLTLVLYYLDTRHALDEQLPVWMIVYGIIYHDEGFSIQAHFPVFHFSSVDAGEWTPRTFGWAFYSVPVKPFNDFSPLSGSRRREIATLLRLQSHARYMLRRLQEWTGYKRTLQLLCKDRSDP